jgi:hypothetical protein
VMVMVPTLSSGKRDYKAQQPDHFIMHARNSPGVRNVVVYPCRLKFENGVISLGV